jgi:DNA-binding GntR family transcriptional regulator
VLTALQARNGVKAEAAMRAHVDAALAARLRGMRDREVPMEDDL